MEQSSWTQKLAQAASWMLVYLAWAITSALALLDVISLRRTILALFVALRLDEWAFAAVDKWLFLAMGLAWLATVLFILYYYNRAYPGNAHLRPLLKPFAIATSVELVLAGVLFVIRQLAQQPS